MFYHYKWPGNVRQLKNEIERAVILTESGWITTVHFLNTIKRTKPKRNKKAYNIQKILKASKENNWVKRKTARAIGIPESNPRARPKLPAIEIPTKF